MFGKSYRELRGSWFLARLIYAADDEQLSLSPRPEWAAMHSGFCVIILVKTKP